jgi:hypothetical protein
MSNPAMAQRQETLPFHPYEYDEFANREEAVGLVKDRMAAGLRGRKLSQPVIVFWGVSGIGKTWLLRHLAHEYRFTPAQHPRHIKKDSCSALVDLKDFTPDMPSWEQLLSQIVEQLVQQLKKRVPPAAKAVLPIHQVAQTPMHGQAELDSLADSFVSFIRELTPKFVPLLLFDSMEILEEKDQAAFHWFEEQIVAPLVRHDQVLTVFAGRKELRRWKQFEVRRRIKKMQLEAFKPEEVEEQFKKAAVSDYVVVGNIIYPYSFGHPFTTWHLQHQLDALRAPEQAFDEQFIADRREEITAALAEIETGLLTDVPYDLRLRLSQASVLRRFHINALRTILVELEMEDSLTQPDSFFLELIGRMVDTHLVHFSRAHQGYTVDPTVRRILNLGLRLREPDEYHARHTKALELYQKWMEILAENCGGFLIEAIFHSAARAAVDKTSPGDLWKEIEELLKALRPEKFNLEGANLLVEELQGDDELRGMLSAWLLDQVSLFDMLLRRARDFQEQVANKK